MDSFGTQMPITKRELVRTLQETCACIHGWANTNRYPSRAAPPFGGRTVHTLSSRSILSKPTSLIKFSELQPESGAEEGVVGAGTVIVSATAGRMWESHIKWLRAIIFV